MYVYFCTIEENFYIVIVYDRVFNNSLSAFNISCSPAFSDCNLTHNYIGEQEIPGLTDTTVPRRLGPKRASKIRKLFNLTKEDDVRQYVVRRPITSKDGMYYWVPHEGTYIYMCVCI